MQSFFLWIILKGRRPGLLEAGTFPSLSGYVMKVSVALNPTAGFMVRALFIFLPVTQTLRAHNHYFSQTLGRGCHILRGINNMIEVSHCYVPLSQVDSGGIR